MEALNQKVYQTLFSNSALFFLNIIKKKTFAKKMSTDTETDSLEHETIDIELKDLNINDRLRANTTFMKVAATIFYYGNQPLTAGQIVNCVRSFGLLPLR